jgi:aminoglycoside phosphotransferase (APT) family kinase protein
MNEITPEFVKTTISKWLAEQWHDCSEIDISSIRAPDDKGNSAETYIIDVAFIKAGISCQRQLVVRRQLEGSDIFLESSLELPYQVMRAVSEHSAVPVPNAIALEMDRSILGSPFLIMDAVPGKVISQSPNYNVQGWLFELPLEKRKEVWCNAIVEMANINSIDWQQGFDFLKRPQHGSPGFDQYLNALETWYNWAANKRDFGVMTKALAYLRQHQPKDMPTCVLWGDSHASNIIFNEDLSVAAIIDWEAATLGTPEIDFGYWLFFDELYSKGAGVERLNGLPNKEEMASCYENSLGRSIRDLKYFEILGALRFAIVLVRFVDRMISLNLIAADSKAAHSNPATHILAEKLGISSPGDLSDFITMNAAAGK